jgi:hypothetical protein
VTPSSKPLFFSIVAIHVLLGAAAATTGLVAMLSPKGPDRQRKFGALYFWLPTLLLLSATAVSAMRSAGAYHLFILGAISFAAAFAGRERGAEEYEHGCPSTSQGWDLLTWLMLVAFHVDNRSIQSDAP